MEATSGLWTLILTASHNSSRGPRVLALGYGKQAESDSAAEQEYLVNLRDQTTKGEQGWGDHLFVLGSFLTLEAAVHPGSSLKTQEI